MLKPLWESLPNSRKIWNMDETVNLWVHNQNFVLLWWNTVGKSTGENENKNIMNLNHISRPNLLPTVPRSTLFSLQDIFVPDPEIYINEPIFQQIKQTQQEKRKPFLD